MEIVVTLDLGFLLLLVDFVVDHQFLLTFVLSLVYHLTAMLLQLLLSLLDKICTLLRGGNFCRLRVRCRGFSNLLVKGGSFGLQDFGKAHSSVWISSASWQLFVRVDIFKGGSLFLR